MAKVGEAVLYIDGENLKHYIKDILEANSITSPHLERLNYQDLFASAIKGINLAQKRFYSARLREYKGSLNKSKNLIKKQRVLKANLEKQGFDFIISGNVRGQNIYVSGKKKVIEIPTFYFTNHPFLLYDIHCIFPSFLPGENISRHFHFRIWCFGTYPRRGERISFAKNKD